MSKAKTKAPAKADAPDAAANTPVDKPVAPQATPGQQTGRAPRIAVTSEVEGFRRGGRAWSRQRAVIAADELTAGQLAAVRAEPLLHVVDLDGE